MPITLSYSESTVFELHNLCCVASYSDVMLKRSRRKKRPVASNRRPSVISALTQIRTRGPKYNSVNILWSILDTCTPDFKHLSKYFAFHTCISPAKQKKLLGNQIG